MPHVLQGKSHNACRASQAAVVLYFVFLPTLVSHFSGVSTSQRTRFNLL